MLLKAEGWEMNTGAEHAGFCQNADASNSVQFHLHVGVAVGITQIGQVRSPCRVLGIPFHNHGIFVQSVRQR